MGNYDNGYIPMTEQEKLWEELGSAMCKNKTDHLKDDKPNTCSFCKKKTNRLLHVMVGGTNVYLCKFFAGILEHMRNKTKDN